MENNQTLFNSLYKRNSDEAGADYFLENAAQQFPYFAATQYFLLEHTAKNTAAFNNQLAKTALFFNNNYWLNFQLLQSNINNIESDTVSASKSEEELELPKVVETITDNTIDTKQDEPLEIAFEKTAATAEEEELIETDSSQIVTTVIANDLENTSNKTIQESVEDNQEVVNEIGILSQEEIVNPAPIESIVEENIASQNKENAEDERGQEETPIEQIENTIATMETVASSPIVEIESEIKPVHTKVEDEAAVAEQTKVQEKTAVTTDELLFEPLHTSDYFASQGIKIADVAKMDDKLGKQLRSFTDWLKTMKKIHTDQATAAPAPQDTSIQLLAEKSNTSPDVLTEAMANIFIQQGRPDKAIEVYKKLSLLNPTKSAFFAAQIENLKTN